MNIEKDAPILRGFYDPHCDHQSIALSIPWGIQLIAIKDNQLTFRRLTSYHGEGSTINMDVASFQKSNWRSVPAGFQLQLC